jgi:hypothetical protein
MKTRVTRLSWFAALWFASVLAVATVAGAMHVLLKWMMSCSSG